MKVLEVKWCDRENPIIKEIESRFKEVFNPLVEDFNNVMSELLLENPESNVEVEEKNINNCINSIVYQFMNYSLGVESILSGDSQVSKKVQTMSLVNKYNKEAQNDL